MNSTREGFTEPSPSVRVRRVNERSVEPGRAYVLYWMIAARRPASNFALDRAIEWSRALQKPLLILEPLRCDYPWASDRLHRFVLDGMAANQRTFKGLPVTYYPYVEPSLGAGKGLLEELSSQAAVVVTDEFPCFFLPRMVASAGRRLTVRVEAVDGTGVLPLSSADRAYTAAVHFRRHMQRELRNALRLLPASEPFRDGGLPPPPEVPSGITSRWPSASDALLSNEPGAMAGLPIDHTVPAVQMLGGWTAARKALTSFVANRLESYHEAHNHPDDQGTSRLSPYLHFGHLASHEIFTAVMRHQRWSLDKLAAKPTGIREGWWGVGPGAEAYLDQLVVWRELAFNTCAKRPSDYDHYGSLPEWARKTLSAHASDRRPHVYTRDEFERAATHDPLWNAAQREMMREGWFHNYMRMLWGKKILEWSATPNEALETMVALMNRWSLDGRDPSSYAGYMWTLGRYDRPWPEREIYGSVRSMSSINTAKKVRVKKYLAQPGLDLKVIG